MLDGAFLSGVGAIVTAGTGAVTGIVAMRRRSEPNGWRALAAERAREVERLERELAGRDAAR